MSKRNLRLGVVTCLAGAACLFVALRAESQQQGPRQVRSALGRCLDVSSGNTGNGASVQLWDCHGSPTQQWIVSGTQIRSALGRCLDVSSGNSANGASVQLWDCNGTPAQTWTLR